ncbi:aromatic ring-hydroxylating dioxygenase subunit alpha [Polynucleobacter sp. CS-Odin-A6]|nr:aromatic ring-hydroxylating dioxygenase subunit alpha [Polynucleobacter sp. CS-Odin-A6]
MFENIWIFACMKQDLDLKSHYGFRVGTKDILIQLDESNTPRAFINSCSHRGSLLCEEGRHSGRVRCPYHGWVYDTEGIPIGIPSKSCFPEVVANPRGFKLNEVSCKEAGNFIFVSLAERPTLLNEFLGKEYDFLESISLGLSNVILEFSKSVQANWKVLIENSLEGYHVPMVHQNTFLVADGMGESIKDISTNFDSNYHSSMNHLANQGWLNSFENKFSKKIGHWPFRTNYYTHHHIFPNLTITSFLGYSFHVQNFKNVSHDLTKVHSRTFSTIFKNQNEVGAKLIKKIYEDSSQFTSKVFDEDTFICEKVQRGLKNAKNQLVLGNGLEERVLHFQKAYTRMSANTDKSKDLDNE